MTTYFNDFQISEPIKQAIKDMGFEEPSPIQEKAIPVILEGGDVIGQAQTGTGKTAAFGIPVVDKVTSDRYVQALILTPTRELAIQVSGELQKLSAHKTIRTLPIYGGQSIGHQIKALKQGVQVVIGTPGRILDHLRRQTLKIDRVHTIVLDEADEMLDMGFVEDIESILRQVKGERQTLLFSATMPPAIKKLSRKYMTAPKTVTINKGEVTAPLINQMYYKVLERNKVDSLCRIIDSEDVELGILFCRTKKGVAELTEALQARGYLADGLHGDLTQSQRDAVMKKFRDSSIEFLIATDVAARGIDVENVTHVINYDIPQDPESYVHRIGRTGRAGRKGLALTLVTPREMKHLRSIEQEIKMSIPSQDVPTIEEVVEKQHSSWKKLISDTIAAGGKETELFSPLVTEILAEHSPEEVVSALLRMNFSTDSSTDETGYHFGETGGAKGMVRFFINVGRNVNMTPKILTEEISELVGIPSKSVGRIDIFENFTFVEVPEEVAPFVYEALRYSRINGARVNLEPAKPRPKRERRTSTTPTTRN
ncbi:DEAD/DEAH box helicase [Halalkalibacter nanhaiisediminis]|uniref:ATP-dependent RNA helicase CshA n=1 Tax=Halalkalibacter nanhaiisediminis TaxID=688079 RepID=A0A562QEU3_9BACI|nr:DEAD/DEAH box helicase [Halalkalibacter nanhaiisediminis]TWI55229.1 ATP-dependent RNA helicase DeaD [Halalkalibacter nanhaiisediminis]